MEPLEKIWIETLARASLNKPSIQTNSQLQRASALFLEELSDLLLRYIKSFNEIVSHENPSLCCQIFKLGAPHPRLILSKGKDKVIISTEGKSIQIKILQVHFNSEKILQILQFEPEYTSLGAFSWRCTDDNRSVNSKLVIENYLASFLVSGCISVEHKLTKLP